MIRHTLHLKAPGNWLNDPNGFIYYKGKYHLFYQHFPYAPVWGTMHWGHAVSTDLVHWEHVGIALFPTRSEDQNGCFSGSALEHDGRMELYYTGIRFQETDPENIHACLGDKFVSSQLRIASEDGFYFDNFTGKQVVIPPIEDEEKGDKKDTRDPKVWEEDGCFYMILGSTCRNETGRVIFYKSRDARNWTYAAQLTDKLFGRCLECPDLFRVGGQYIFMGSPMDISDAREGYRHHAVCMPVEFDRETCGLRLTGSWQYIDYGQDIYAPQTCVDKDGRRVMTAWMRMPEAVAEPGQKPWNGMMCMPRIVEVEDGHVYFRVHPEVDAYFERRDTEESERVQIAEDGKQMPVRPFRLKVSMAEGEELDIGGYKIRLEEGCVRTDRSRVFAGIEGCLTVCSTPELEGECRLDIFVDEHLIEIFVNEGQYVISNVVYGLGD